MPPLFFYRTGVLMRQLASLPTKGYETIQIEQVKVYD